MSRYSFQLMSKVTGIPVYRLEARRRQEGMTWERDYDLDGVRQIIGDAQLVPRESINPRAKRALELWDALNGGDDGQRTDQD